MKKTLKLNVETISILNGEADVQGGIIPGGIMSCLGRACPNSFWIICVEDFSLNNIL